MLDPPRRHGSAKPIQHNRGQPPPHDEGRMSDVFYLKAGDTDSHGEYNAEWIGTFGDGSVETYPNDGYDNISIGARL